MNVQTARYESEEFETVAEAKVDSRGRISLGDAGATPGRRYRVERNVDGVLLLIPVVSIPEREMIVWKNPELARSILEGIDQAEAAQTVERPGFTAGIEDGDED
jgi:hypothetical protein